MKSKPTLKPAEVNSHSRQLRQRSPRIRWRWTAMAKEARKARKGKVMASAARKKNQSPNPNKDAVCWHCGKKCHLSTECLSNPKNQSGSGGTQHKGGKGKPNNVTDKGAGSLELGDREGCLRWTHALNARIGTETQANDCSDKTASGELISDRGGFCVQGTTEYGYGVTFQGTTADGHKTLISASKVHSARKIQ